MTLINELKHVLNNSSFDNNGLMIMIRQNDDMALTSTGVMLICEVKI